MFRLLKSGLPKDPIFPKDLEGLGYFINEDDEVRMISNPRAYFDFFRTKNDRHNCVRREAMNACLRDEILTRLTNLGLETIRLPLGASEIEAHVPILVSANISLKKRVIILFYEHTQDLGVFAYRAVGGRGGINAGSAVNFVKYVQSLSGPNGKDSPGIILANLGQLRWWRRGKKAVTQTSWYSLPQTSSAGSPYRFDVVKNTIPGNRNAAEHIEYVFQHVVPKLLAPEATLEVIGVSVGAVDLVDFLNKPKNWEAVQPRLTALALVATFHQRDEISNPWFADWLRKCGRAYVISNKRASTAIATSEGNIYTDPENKSMRFNNCYGCPVFSLGEPHYSEMMLPMGYKVILDWFQEVAAGGEQYENPEIIVVNSNPLRDVAIEDIDFEEAKKCLVLIQGRKRAAHNAKSGTQEVRDDEVNTVDTDVEGNNGKEWEPANLNIADLTISEPTFDTNIEFSKDQEPQLEKQNIDAVQDINSKVLPSNDKETSPTASPSYKERQEIAAKAFFKDLQRSHTKIPEWAVPTLPPKEDSVSAEEENTESSEAASAQEPHEEVSKDRDPSIADVDTENSAADRGAAAAADASSSK